MSYLQPAKELLSFLNKSKRGIEIIISKMYITVNFALNNKNYIFPNFGDGVCFLEFIKDETIKTKFIDDFEWLTTEISILFLQAIHELEERKLIFENYERDLNKDHFYISKVYFPTLKGSLFTIEDNKVFWEKRIFQFLLKYFPQIEILLTSENEEVRNFIKKYKKK